MDPEAYGAKLYSYLDAGSAALSIAIAKETGVLDILLEADKAMTSQEVADKKQLKERYVRELLAALAVAEVIQVDSGSTLYHVPEAFKPALRGTAPFCRVISHMGRRQPAVKECFPIDGPEGVPFSSQSDIFDIMEDYRINSLESLVEDDILTVVPGLKEKLEKGIAVAEFGCATGNVIIKIASMFPASTFTGYDMAKDVLETARKRASVADIQNVCFKTADLYNVPDDINNNFDWVFVNDVIHDLAYPDKALAGLFNPLKSGGTFSMIDTCTIGPVAKEVGNTGASYLLSCSLMICLPEGSCQKNSAKLGAGWQVDKARGHIEAAGFKVKLIFHSKSDEHVVHFVCEK